MSAYDWFMLVVVPFGILGFFVVGLVRHEERLQEMEKKIDSSQERFLNRR